MAPCSKSTRGTNSQRDKVYIWKQKNQNSEQKGAVSQGLITLEDQYVCHTFIYSPQRLFTSFAYKSVALASGLREQFCLICYLITIFSLTMKSQV